MPPSTPCCSGRREIASQIGGLPVVRRSVAALLLAIGLAGTTTIAAQDLKSGELTIRATGFTHARGHAIAKIFARGDSVLGSGRWQVSATIRNEAALFRMPGLQAGAYAVVVFHDENDNGVIDHGVLGPSESIGFSGGFVLGLVSGKPSFERLKFEFEPPAQALEVSVRRGLF